MTKPLTDAMATAMLEGYARAMFASIGHPSGTGYFWTGIGTKTWNGHTWRGSGVLGAIAPIKSATDLSIQELSFKVAGVDAEIAAGLNENVRNYKAQVWLACLDDRGNVVPDPYQLVDAELDYQVVDYAEDGTATVSIIGNSGFYTLARGVDDAWTPESQKLRYPTDTGLDLIPSLQKHDLQWTPT